MQAPLFPKLEPVEAARARFDAELEREREATCPCCERRARIYRRRLHSAPVWFLVRLVALHEANPPASRRWYHTRAVLRLASEKASTDACYLVHFGLLEQGPADARHRRGLYRPTRAGVAFVRGEATAPAWVDLLDGRRVAVAPQSVRVGDALGVRFDFEALFSREERRQRTGGSTPAEGPSACAPAPL